MFENPRRGRQARNFTTNAPKILDLKSSFEQIFSRKLPLGAPIVGSVAVLYRYPARRGFSLAWLLAFTKSFAWLVCRVVGLFTTRVCFSRRVTKPTTRQASHANDFVNAKSHARKKPLLVGYIPPANRYSCPIHREPERCIS